MLSALDGWLNLDDALDELPTGTRDELCVQAFTQALEDIEKLHAQVRARLSVQQIQGLLDAAILTATGIGDQVGTTSLAISVKLSRTVNRRRAPASAGTTSPAGTWSPSSHGARGGTTSTSCRRRSSAISTEHSSKLLCTSSLTSKAPRHHRAAYRATLMGDGTPKTERQH